MASKASAVLIGRNKSSEYLMSVVNIPLDTKYVILEMLFPANILASTENFKIEASRKKL